MHPCRAVVLMGAFLFILSFQILSPERLVFLASAAAYSGYHYCDQTCSDHQ